MADVCPVTASCPGGLCPAPCLTVGFACFVVGKSIDQRARRLLFYHGLTSVGLTSGGGGPLYTTCSAEPPPILVTDEGAANPPLSLHLFFTFLFVSTSCPYLQPACPGRSGSAPGQNRDHGNSSNPRHKLTLQLVADQSFPSSDLMKC